jgi:integrase
MHYFGPWADPAGALARYEAQRVDLHAGRKPRVPIRELTLAQLVERFLTSKQAYVDSSELSPRTLRDYWETGGLLIDHFGPRRLVNDLHPDDFESLRAAFARRRGPVSLRNVIQRVRTLFAYAYDQGLLLEPMRYGSGFDKPTRKTLRLFRQRQQATRGRRMFEAAELRTLLDAAPTTLRAMLLLAINCGYGQSDIAGLTDSALRLEAGWIDYPRPKTGIERRCPLWPETIAALRDVLATRGRPRDPAEQHSVFLTRFGRRWVRCTAAGHPDDAIGKAFAKLLSRLELKRPGLNFYALRHTFETIAGDALDQVAVDAVMGHHREDMASAYRERIADARLVAIVEHVRQWLFDRAVKAAA